MKIKKLKEKLHEIETQNITASDKCPTEDEDPTDSPSMEKKKTKKKSIMQIESTKNGVSRKPKGLKSKDNHACADNSKKSGSTTRKRALDTDLYDGVEAKFSVMERADRVLERLENEHKLPYFLKRMLPSNVSHGFWLHLPKKFCNVHFPNHDTSISLVDEWGNEYKTFYFLERHGLSAGWRGFAVAHRLLKGDILIFHLIGPCKLQVHIVRVSGSDVVSAALCLLSLYATQRGTDGEDLENKDKRKRKRATKYVEPFLPGISTPGGKNMRNQSASNTGVFSSESLEDSDTTVRPRCKKAICCPEPSFLHEDPHAGVICR
ncbi:hypothetical protein OROGR_031528 [Orobanche gracilis]